MVSIRASHFKIVSLFISVLEKAQVLKGLNNPRCIKSLAVVSRFWVFLRITEVFAEKLKKGE